MNIWRKWRNPRQKPPFGAMIDWSDTITEGLVGCWLLNEQVGYLINDLASYVGDGRFTYVFGFVEWAPVGLLLGGGAVSLSVRNFSTLSIVAKIYHSGSSNNEQILTKDAATYSQRSWQFRKDANNKLQYIHFNTDTDIDAFSSYTTIVGDPCFVAVTDDSTVAKLFINGKLDASLPVSGPIQFANNPIFMGRSENSTPELFRGYIFYCYVFDRALLDDEIERLYHKPYSFFLVPAARIFDLAPSSGTTFQKTVEGALSSSGEASLRFSAGQLFGGLIGPLGALGWEVSKYTEGELGPSGELQKEGQYEFSGALGPSGELSVDLSAGNALSGGVSASGSLSLQVSRERAFGGFIEASGTLLLNVHKTYLGQVNPSGVALNDQQEVELTADKLVGSRQKETLP